MTTANSGGVGDLYLSFLGSVNARVYDYALSSALSQPELWDPSPAIRQDPACYDKLRKDPVISLAFYYRKLLSAGTRWNLIPRGRDKPDRDAAKLVESWLRELEGFTLLRFNLSEAIVQGSRWARVYLEEREIATPLGRGKWVVPAYARDVDKRRFRQARREVSQDDYLAPALADKGASWPWEVYRPEKRVWEDAYDLSDGDDDSLWIHHVVDDSESSLGYGNGLADDLIVFAWAKSQLIQYMLGWTERWGQGGFVIAKIASAIQGQLAGGRYENTKTSILDALKKMRSEHVFATPKDDEITIVEPSSVGIDFILQCIRYLDSAMTRRVLFAELPTGGAQEAGSLARAREEGDSTETAMIHDRALLDEALTRDLITALWERNFDRLPESLKTVCIPDFSLLTQKKFDASKRVDDIVKLLNAGVALRKDEVYEAIQFSMPSEDDDVFGPDDVPSIQQAKADTEALRASNGGPKGDGESGANKDEDTPDAQAKAAEKEIEKERNQMRARGRAIGNAPVPGGV